VSGFLFIHTKVHTRPELLPLNPGELTSKSLIMEEVIQPTAQAKETPLFDLDDIKHAIESGLQYQKICEEMNGGIGALIKLREKYKEIPGHEHDADEDIISMYSKLTGCYQMAINMLVEAIQHPPLFLGPIILLYFIL